MSEFVVRDAELADARSMAEIIAAGREQAYNLTPGSEDYWQLVTSWRGERGEGTMRRYMMMQGEWRDLGDQPRARVAVQIGSGAVKGVMTSRQVAVHNQRGVNLDLLFVDPEVQGRGIGSLLMDDFAEYAAGRPQIVEVKKDNLPARRLYEKYGFQIVGAANSEYSLNESIEMVKLG